MTRAYVLQESKLTEVGNSLLCNFAKDHGKFTEDNYTHISSAIPRHAK